MHNGVAIKEVSNPEIKNIYRNKKNYEQKKQEREAETDNPSVACLCFQSMNIYVPTFNKNKHGKKDKYNNMLKKIL